MQDALVSTEWLHDHLTDDSVRVLEVVSSDDRECRFGHVPGSSWVFWQGLCWDDDVRQFATPTQMADRLSNLGIANDNTLVVMSDQPQYATYLYWMMTMAGISNAPVLDGSRTAWVLEGRPISVAVQRYQHVDRSPGNTNQSSRVGRDDVLEHLSAPGRLVVNARSPEKYRGERVMPLPSFDHGAQRVGRIPAAVHLYYRLLLNDDDTFKNREEIAAVSREVGISPDKELEIVTYCRLTHRAILVWFALTKIIGLGDIRIYDGSWTERHQYGRNANRALMSWTFTNRPGQASDTCDQPMRHQTRGRDMQERIGVLGLGVMGIAMSKHLLAAGYEVHGFDVIPEKVDVFAGLGGLPEESGVAVAQSSDIVILSLPSVVALEQATEDLLLGAHEGQLAIEMGTLPLEAKERARETLAAARIDLMDVPVSGTGLQAEDGTLVVFASGSPEAFDRSAPLFETIGRSTHYLGDFGNGSVMKYIANLLVAVHTLAAAEAHALGIASGMDPALVQEVMSDGVGSSKIFDIRGPMMVNDVYSPPSARLSIILKDAGIIKAYARDVGAPTPLLDAAIPVYDEAAETFGELDAAALCRHLENLGDLHRSGVEPTDEGTS